MKFKVQTCAWGVPATTILETTNEALAKAICPRKGGRVVDESARIWTPKMPYWIPAFITIGLELAK